MDSYREIPSDVEPSEESSHEETVAIEIGTDERRMHVRAYNHWVSLLDGRDYPSIEDLEPGDLKDFANHSVLLDFTSGRNNPATPYIGTAIRAECDLDDEVRSIADVPSRSLLSRLTDHYMQIIANRAPVGFEAEFENQRGDNICYRGILMPFSSDGDTIDFIYGVINWKTVSGEQAQAPQAAQPYLEVEQEEEPIEPVEAAAELAVPFAAEHDAPEIEPVEIALPEIELDDNAGLADRLWAARECAAEVREADGRSRDSLYRALGRAHDFAIASKAEPGDYAELLEESGVKAQARAPMTPIVKLVFGVDYNKARLTEFAAALSYAERMSIGFHGFVAFIGAQAGGLKALVAAERQARRPESKVESAAQRARELLRSAQPLSLSDISGDEEFALVVTRRTGDGRHEAIAIVDDKALVERAIRRAAA
ncbi:MAG: hypothetical protein H0W39_05950 [Sphingomonas sp.]|nr:hypothetical protein [Sphingomonas sp.]